MYRKAFFYFFVIIGLLSTKGYAQTFSKAQITFDNKNITIQDTGYKNTHPCMADFDNDGDIDLIIGTNQSSLIYYRNDDIDTNIGGTDSTLNGTKLVLATRALISNIQDANHNILHNLTPTAGDIDGDGKIDIIVGASNGEVYLLKNTGITNNLPQFSTPERILASNSKSASAPFLADMDGDGDLDLFVGYLKGDVDYYENSGDSSNYNFSLKTTDILGSYNVFQSVIPCLYDVNKDGTLDMILGRKNRTLAYYTGSVSSGEITFTHQTDKWNNLGFDLFTSPFLADLENDGNTELLVGQYNGQIKLYTNALNTPSLVTQMFGSIDVGYLAVPLFFDIDGDGDLDLLVAHKTQIALFENTSNSNINFNFKTIAFFTTSQPIISLDTWDYDNDGDLDIFFGTTSGGVGLLKNNGYVNGSVSLTEVYTGYGYNGATQSFDHMVTPNPDASICIADLDGDGDMDFLITNQYGTSTFYRNDDINTNTGGEDETIDGWQAGKFVKVKAGYGTSDSYFPFTLPGYNSIKERDLDGDGDLDFLTTGADGKIYKITNTGNAKNPTYTKDSTPLSNIQFDDQSTYLIKTKIDIRDFNGDGWYDIVLGGGEGGLKFYTNTASQDTTAPSQPGNFSAQALSESKIRLTWDISTDINGTGVKEYVIKRYQSGTLQETIHITNPVATSYLDKGLTQETTYDYEIVAIDYAGNESNVATAQGQTGPPPQLDHFEITTPSGVVGKHFNITIKAISNYGFLLDNFNEEVTLTPSEGTISPTTATLVNGQKTIGITYSNSQATGNIQLTITVAYGSTSNNSNAISIDIIPPTTPQLYQANVASSTNVALLWNTITDTGGATNYYVDIYRNGTRIATISGNSTTYTDTSCQPNTTYTYYLKTRDSAGNVSPASNSKTVTTPQPEEDETPPSVPTGLTVVSTGETFIAFKWNPSTDTGGSGLAGYKIYRGATLIATVNASTTSYTDEGLTPGTTYTYHLRSYDNAGNYSDFSSALTATTKPHESDTIPPTVPQNLQASAVDDHSISLTWNASTDSGGSGLAGYRIYREDVNNYGTSIASVSANTTSYTDTRLEPGTTYKYKIRAIDNAGNISNYSNMAKATTTDSSVDRQPPTTPTNVQIKALSPTDAKITWNASTDNVAVKQYEIFQVTPSDDPFTNYTYTQIGETRETTFIISNLNPGDSYDFAVRAVDTSDNHSRYSEFAHVDMPNASNDHTPPYPPENLHFVSKSHDEIVIGYDEAHDDENGSGIKKYHIFRNDTEIGTTENTQFTDDTVTAGETYTYYVKSEDWNGNMSEPSQSITTKVPVVDNDNPSTPSNLTYEATPDKVILTWGMSYDPTTGVDHYEIQKVNSPFKVKEATKENIYATTTDTTYTDTNVVVGAKYVYYVFAVDAVGNKSIPAKATVIIPEEGEIDYTLYFPHIDVTDMWWTGFAVVNPGESEAHITYKFYDNNGNEVFTKEENIPPKGKVVATIRNFFDDNVPEGAAWYKIESDTKIEGFELFGTTDWNEMVGVKIFSKPAKQLIYPEVKSDDTFWTGIAIINIGENSTEVKFKAYDSNGNLLAESNPTFIPSNGKKVALIEDLFDSFPSETSYLVAENTENIIGFELFGYKTQVGLAGLSALPFGEQNENSSPKLSLKTKSDNTKTLSAIVVSSTEVELMWDAIDPTPDLYRIYEVKEKSTPFGPALEKIKLWGETTATQYTVSGLTPDTDYKFAVYPVYGNEEKDPTNVVSVHTFQGGQEIIYTYICPRIEELLGGNTEIALLNTGSETANIKIQILGTGAEVLANTEVSLNSLTKKEFALTSLFDQIPETSNAIRIISNQSLVAWEIFENNCDNGNNNGYYDTLYAFDKALSKVNFTHIAPETYMWDSFVAVWNLASEGNSTKFTAYAKDGSILGVYNFDIAPDEVIGGEIHDFIPDDELLQNIGWIQVTGTQPMNGYFAFGNKDKTLMGAIEGQ